MTAAEMSQPNAPSGSAVPGGGDDLGNPIAEMSQPNAPSGVADAGGGDDLGNPIAEMSQPNTPSRVADAGGGDDLGNPIRTNSRLLDGWVHHSRTRPRENSFRYRLWHLLLDVDELDHLDATLPGFGHNRPAPIALYDKDHFGDAPMPLREKISRWVAGQGRELPDGPLLFTAYPRVLGYTFNPVCWWFAHDTDGALQMAIAEVRNTFGDWYPYLLDDLEGGATKVSERPKNFHVSPFLPIEGLDYTFKVHGPTVGAPPGDRVAVHMDVDGPDGHVFDATQAQRTVALTGRNLLWWNLRHPLMTLRTIFLIHAQAVKLFFKRATFYPRPDPPDTGIEHVRNERVRSRVTTDRGEERTP